MSTFTTIALASYLVGVVLATLNVRRAVLNYKHRRHYGPALYISLAVMVLIWPVSVVLGLVGRWAMQRWLIPRLK